MATFRALDLAGHGPRRLLPGPRHRRALRQRGEHHPRVHRRVDVPQDVGGVGARASRRCSPASSSSPSSAGTRAASFARASDVPRRQAGHRGPNFPCIAAAPRSYIRRGKRKCEREARCGASVKGTAFSGDGGGSLAPAAWNAVSGDSEARASRGYTGGKSALYALIASVRPRRSRPLGDHDKVPGEIARHGFGQVEVRCVDGHERTFTIFVSRLEYSGWVAASLVPDQSVESCVRVMAAHYAAMGGVPLLAAFDRARPIGIRADATGHVVEWDPRSPTRPCSWGSGSRCGPAVAPTAGRERTSATG